MAKMTRTYEVKFRRRREGKTDYQKRLNLLKSGTDRFVVRRTNNHVVVQVVHYLPSGDNVRASAHSKELSQYGWKGHHGNIPAAYLTGYLAGLKAKKEGVENCIADLGMIIPTHGSRSFAAVKGGIDAGISIPADDVAFPKEDRIRGEHIARFAEKATGNQFAALKKNGTSVAKLAEQFEQVKKELEKKFA